MPELPDMSSKAWVSLLWSQYNKLSKPLKDGFSGLAQQIAKETDGQNLNPKVHDFPENDVSVDKGGLVNGK